MQESKKSGWNDTFSFTSINSNKEQAMKIHNRRFSYSHNGVFFHYLPIITIFTSLLTYYYRIATQHKIARIIIPWPRKSTVHTRFQISIQNNPLRPLPSHYSAGSDLANESRAGTRHPSHARTLATINLAGPHTSSVSTRRLWVFLRLYMGILEVVHGCSWGCTWVFYF